MFSFYTCVKLLDLNLYFIASNRNILDDDDEDEEEEEESEEEVSAGASGTLASLYNADLPSEDDEDGDYDSNEEPEGSDGDDDEESQDEIIQPTEGNDEGAGSSG